MNTRGLSRPYARTGGTCFRSARTRRLPVMSRKPLVLGHRGASAAAPENTVAAFARARELGADGVELDVRRSADGVLVVHHDPDLRDAGPIKAMTLAELRATQPDLATLEEAFD